MRPLAFEISQRESVSTLRCNVSPIVGIATNGLVAALGARIRAAGGGDEKRAEAQLIAGNFN
jgi:hypothetical protein